MRNLARVVWGLTLICSFAFCSSLQAVSLNDEIGAITDAKEIPITVDNFVRAATDMEIGKYLALSGGVNRLYHVRQPTSIDEQPTIRMNRDTLYSSAVVDISEGATLTIPDTDGRYLTAMIVNQDHYINKVFSDSGSYTLDLKTYDTPYVIVIFRILVDASDDKDIAKVHAIQDGISLKASSAKPFILPNYDDETFETVLKATIQLSRSAPDSFGTFGAKADVDPVRHFLGTAFGWGGLPENEAFYLVEDTGLPVGEYKIDVPQDVPVEAFWSISIYNADGFFQPNNENAYNVNSVSGERNADGSMTVHLGGCGDDRVNCLPITEGWNYTVRLYKPGPEVLSGKWVFPAAQSIR